MNKHTLGSLALGGIFGPVLFVTVVLISVGLRPGYSHISQTISELGATGTPNALVMNIGGFMLTGVMIIAFGVALILFLPTRFITRMGSVFIVIFGLGFLVVGNVSSDAGFPLEGSFENAVHYQVSGPMFLFAIIGILLLGISFRILPLWRPLWVYSVVTALMASSLVVILINSIEARVFTGVWQRLMIFTIFLWCGIVSLRMFRLSRKKAN